MPNYFYPRPPRGGRRVIDGNNAVSYEISIHALREEGDDEKTGDFSEEKEFLSTPSARRATGGSQQHNESSSISIHALREEGDLERQEYSFTKIKFLSTPSARRATLAEMQNIILRAISIHALREEGDRKPRRTGHPQKNFYPRPPRGGRPATSISGAKVLRDFYPRPPRGGRHLSAGARKDVEPISIHALREEGDRFRP